MDAKRRGNFADWPRWVQDVLETTAYAKRAFPNRPLIYARQSTGSIVALNAASKSPADSVRGLILQSPAVLFVDQKASIRPMLALLEFLTLNQSRFTAPAAILQFQKPIMCNDEDEKTWETSSDRVCRGFTFHSLAGCFSLGADTKKIMGSLSVPVLIQFGRQDPLLDAEKDHGEAAEGFVARCGTGRKTIQWYDPGRHDMLNDSTTRAKLLVDVDRWLRASD